MRQFFRYLLIALLLVTVFLVSALMSMRFAIHGREAEVPRLTGLTLAEAQRSAAASGMLLDVENRFYSSELVEGRILSQVPAPGTKVRRGGKVKVAESLGPQRVAIPNVIGQSERAAEINLVQRGLQLGTVASAHFPGLPAEQVVAQSPPPNAVGVASPKVNLLLTAPVSENTPAFVMPDFVGRRFGEATSAIAVAGFKVGAVTVTARTLAEAPANDKPARLKPIATDTVIAQSPAAGQKIQAGTLITLEVMR